MSELETCIEDRGTRWQLRLLLDGAAVSGLGVVKMRMRVGSVPVRTGGIAGVWTDEKQRLKGYASRAMWESISLMVKQKYEMSILYGIQDFYHRFGYGVVFPGRSMLYVKTEDLLQAGAVERIRAMRKADGPEVARLYNRLNASRTATAVRPKGWRYFRISAGFGGPGKAVVVLNRRGQIAGYAAYGIRDEQFIVSEVGGAGGSVFETLAVALGRRARRAGVVVFHLPADDPFGAFCTRYGGRWEIQCSRNSGAMGRIVRLAPLVERLLPELNRRLEACRCSWKGRLGIETDIGSVGLEVDGEAAAVAPVSGRRAVTVSMPQMALTQLVMGYRDAKDVAYDADVHIPVRALEILGVLFPKGHAYMWWSDRI